MTKAIFITAYKRDEILLDNLKLLKKCKCYSDFKMLIIFQNPKLKTLFQIKKIDPNIKIIKTSYPSYFSVYSKVNNNVMKGFSYCFDKIKADYVIHLEDDITPSYDFLYFSNYIINKYQSDKNFFAFNGFSKENKIVNKFAYSKFIYGIGKGWAVPKQNFKILQKAMKGILKPSVTRFFDTHLELIIKRKFFVVMPYRSRTLERPSNGLTVKINFKFTKFYKEWKKSFMGNEPFPLKKYNYIKHMEYGWRKDCLPYSQFNKLKSMCLFLITKIYYFAKRIAN